MQSLDDFIREYLDHLIVKEGSYQHVPHFVIIPHDIAKQVTTDQLIFLSSYANISVDVGSDPTYSVVDNFQDCFYLKPQSNLLRYAMLIRITSNVEYKYEGDEHEELLDELINHPSKPIMLISYLLRTAFDIFSPSASMCEYRERYLGYLNNSNRKSARLPDQ